VAPLKVHEEIMSLTLHYHPLSSFCMKALVGLYELGIPFEKKLVDLADEAERARFLALWPLGRFPVIRDEARGITVPETSIVLEYVDRDARLIPSDRERGRECRLRDRFFDLYVNTPMQKIVTDKLRPEGEHDSFGVDAARAQLEIAYGVADEWLRDGPWALGEAFTMADCAAAPALFYAEKVLAFGRNERLARYLARLVERPSFARVLEEAKPYFAMFPG
jgi:glutathione S-transferase